MKKGILILIMFIVSCLSGNGQTNFSDQISQLWFDGHKSNVLEIANNRLAANSNDIAGLLLKMAYELEFLQDEELTNTMERVLAVGSTITTTNFAVKFPGIQDDVNTLKEVMVLFPYSQEELESERAKGFISGKPFMYYDIMVALEQDGLLP